MVVVLERYVDYLLRSKPSKHPSSTQLTSNSLSDHYTYILHTIRPRHVLLLVRALDSRNPIYPVRRIKLNRRLRIIQRIDIIHHTDLDDLGLAESRPVTPHGAAAVRAEMRRDLVACIVALLGDSLGLAGEHGEAVAGDDDVGAVGGAGDFAAVFAMA